MTVAASETSTSALPADAVPPGMLRVRGLVKRYTERTGSGNVVNAVDGVSYDIEPGTMLTLLGPSGCGKTTTLRSVAGLETPDDGVIQVGPQTLYSARERTNVPPNRRNLGMVFQSYAIWPHMSVFKNAAFPLVAGPRGRRVDRTEVRKRVQEVLEAVQLGHLADRPSTDLSGGQQQRLALARALVLRPPMLLLDEPLSNLDAKLREDMRLELKNLQRSLGITALYVTHDQIEALAMSHVVAVMNAGRIEQMGRPRDIYDNPVSHFVADFIGSCNFLKGTVVRELDGGEYRVRIEGTEVTGSSRLDWKVGDETLVAVRPENVEVVRQDEEVNSADADDGALEAVVEARGYLGEAVEHLVSVGEYKLRSRAHVSTTYAPNTRVLVRFRRGTCRLIRADSGVAPTAKAPSGGDVDAVPAPVVSNESETAGTQSWFRLRGRSRVPTDRNS